MIVLVMSCVRDCVALRVYLCYFCPGVQLRVCVGVCVGMCREGSCIPRHVCGDVSLCMQLINCTSIYITCVHTCVA